MGEVFLEVQNEKFGTVPMSADEGDIFAKQYAKLFYPPWSLERRYLDFRKQDVIDGIGAAKDSLEEKKFGGFNCGANELGISPIRPGHVGLCRDGDDTHAEADNVWKWVGNATVPSYTTGFDGWIHSAESDTTAFAVHKDSFIIPLYIIEEQASPRLQTIKIDVGRSDILQYDVSACRIRDATNGISLIPLPTMFWGPEVPVLVAIQAKEAGALEIRLGGFTVALGTFLDATTYTPSGSTVATATVATT